MGFFQRSSSVAGARRMQAANGDPSDPFYGSYGAYVPPLWVSTLSAAGIPVTPDLAMTLSAYSSGVRMIGADLATLPQQVFKYRDDGGKDRVRAGASQLGTGGIGSLVYLLRWQPNAVQTAAEYIYSQVAQYLMREIAYSEIITGPSGFIEQLLPRHPDRVTPERLPSGRLRYRLTEADGKPRFLTQDEMHVVRGLSFDVGASVMSRVQYGAQSIGSALATQRAAGRFFKNGMAATVVATYKGGQMEEGEEDNLHKSISRYASGADTGNAGLLLIPDDIDVKNLSVDPEKAQMMLAQEWGVREVARHLNLPGSKLGIKDSVAYASQIQDALNYVINCLRPIAVFFEQAIQRDLILAKDTYFVEFALAALLRGDPDTQAKVIAELIKVRVMRPSEARLLLNMNPDPALDKLSEQDFRPGTGSTPAPQQQGASSAVSSRAAYIAMMAIRSNAEACMRRERLAVERLAKKHANDPDGWKQGLREFEADHALFISTTMRISPDVARGVAAQHGSEFEAKGTVLIEGKAADAWESYEADELAALALAGGDPQVIDAWFASRPELPEDAARAA